MSGVRRRHLWDLGRSVAQPVRVWTDSMKRTPYRESVALLEERTGCIGDALSVIDRVPRHDDEALGPSTFRMFVDEASREHLTLSAPYVGRSELRRVSFVGADLCLAAFNWSTLVDCSFGGAWLVGADLRASRFVGRNFLEANLAQADRRRSTFERCRFDDAELDVALLHAGPLGLFRLPGTHGGLKRTALQRGQVRWCGDAPGPGGG